MIKNIYDSNKRKHYTKFISIINLFLNLLLCIIKFIVGITIKSISLMSDAANSVSDTFSSVLTIVGLNLSNKNKDKLHPYGFNRYEYLTTFTISIFMLIMGFIFLKKSIIKIIFPVEIITNISIYIILLIVLLIKILQMFLYLKFYKITDSKPLKASYYETRNDVFTSIAIIISMLLVDIFKINIDGYLGFIVSLFIIVNSISSLKDSINDLVGNIDLDYIDDIGNLLLEYEDIIDITDINIHSYGYDKNYVVVYAIIDDSVSVKDICNKIDFIENNFRFMFNIKLSIHIKPIKNK